MSKILQKVLFRHHPTTNTTTTGLNHRGLSASKFLLLFYLLRHKTTTGSISVRRKKMATETELEKKFRLIDIGANLLDDMYNGMYNGSEKHEADLSVVLDRAEAAGVERIFVTAGSLRESRKAANQCKELSEKSKIRFSSTVGVHPTRCLEFEAAFSPSAHLSDLLEVYTANPSTVVALGEFGLDVDRICFCPYDEQLQYFELQLRELGPTTGLPLFLHCRGPEAATDLIKILRANQNCFPGGGVVHSFDGSTEVLNQLLELGLYIGVNGCSLKTEEACDVIREVPEDRLLLETDSPWCSIRPSHYSSKFIKTPFPVAKKNYTPGQLYKTRNEPCALLNILEAVAGIRGVPEEDLAKSVHENTTRLFKLDSE